MPIPTLLQPAAPSLRPSLSLAAPAERAHVDGPGARFDEALRKKRTERAESGSGPEESAEASIPPTAADELQETPPGGEPAEPAAESGGEPQADAGPATDDQPTPEASAEPEATTEAANGSAADAEAGSEAAVPSRPFTIHALNSLLLRADAATRRELRLPADRVVAPDGRSDGQVSPRAGRAETRPEPFGQTAAEPSRGGSESAEARPEAAAGAAGPKIEQTAGQSAARTSGPSDAGGPQETVRPERTDTPSPVARTASTAVETPAAAQQRVPRLPDRVEGRSPDLIAKLGASVGASAVRGGPAGSGRAGAREAILRPPAPDGSAFTAQVSRGLLGALNRADGSVTLRLRPDALGELKIRVFVGESGVSARFEAASPEARRMLSRSMDALRDSLRDKGLSVGEFRVQIADPREPVAPVGGHDPSADAQQSAPSDPDGRGGGPPRDPWTNGAAELRPSAEPDDGDPVVIPVAISSSIFRTAPTSAYSIDAIA